MKIAHCNCCGKNWYDTNPGENSIEYLEDTEIDGELILLKEDEDGPTDWYWGCPVCKTDAYLKDNKDED